MLPRYSKYAEQISIQLNPIEKMMYLEMMYLAFAHNFVDNYSYPSSISIWILNEHSPF